MLRRRIKNLLLQLGISATPVDTVAATVLIRKLRPVTTRFPLVRIGGDRDGAYLVPDDLDGITALFSPGVEDRATFEQYFADRGVPCYLADASVTRAPVEHPLFHFEPRFLGISNQDNLTTLDSWIERHAPGDGDLILQMDIENAEWSVLANVSDATLQRFRIIVIELHEVHRILDSALHRDILSRILQTHHVVHAHPNNALRLVNARGLEVPPLVELTLLRKDRATPTGYASAFPHELDIINVAHEPPIHLPRSWYGA